MDFNSWNKFWSSVFGLLAVLIVLCNFFTIWAFHKQRRRKRTYFLLISLAVTDLLVGLLTIPFFIKNSSMESSPSLWHVSTSFDVFTGLTSIYTLAVVSLERMFATIWPLRHRTLTFCSYISAIAIPWVSGAIFTLLMILHFNEIELQSYNILLILFLVTPLLTICVAYLSIWIKQKSTKGVRNHRAARESKLANTLLLITGASLFTWTPFQISQILLVFEGFRIPHILIYLIKLLQFSNSLVNVLIYPLRMPDFQTTLKNIFQCIRTRRSTIGPSSQAIHLKRIAYCDAK
ncbi:trace amine-associated receptor 7b-like [Stylophora pistillata]|uniref:trace amine-associated receptor 7b-like n=1 Tax=Stylophora pistillata TaxID=50429 RepID=UPI000C041EDF|nr:trace amine-associated receptor 7b-like [Stylophora pistillata]